MKFFCGLQEDRVRITPADKGGSGFVNRLKSQFHPDWLSAIQPPEQIQYIVPKKKKVGLFTALAALAAGSALAGRGKKKHDGHCDGDCANCPPHYGYRYGRWYYGKGHQYGCEFGGNKGDGSL